MRHERSKKPQIMGIIIFNIEKRDKVLSGQYITIKDSAIQVPTGKDETMPNSLYYVENPFLLINPSQTIIN